MVMFEIKTVMICSMYDAQFMWDQKTGSSRGYGFVFFRNQQLLILCHKHLICCFKKTSEFLVCAFPVTITETTLFRLQDAQSAINGLNGIPLIKFLVMTCDIVTTFGKSPNTGIHF
jgi:hypothetical protein